MSIYLKSSQGTLRPTRSRGHQTGNDQMAFYSTVPGYYPMPGNPYG